jgi:hypothetical protein
MYAPAALLPPHRCFICTPLTPAVSHGADMRAKKNFYTRVRRLTCYLGGREGYLGAVVQYAWRRPESGASCPANASCPAGLSTYAHAPLFPLPPTHQILEVMLDDDIALCLTPQVGAD